LVGCASTSDDPSADDAGRTLGEAGSNEPGTGGSSHGTGGDSTSAGGSEVLDATPPNSGAANEAGPSTTGREGSGASDAAVPSSTVIAGCSMLPQNHVFNTPIDRLPRHPSSDAFMTAVGKHNIHLDLGTSIDLASADYYGIPYNVVHADTETWTRVSYTSTDTANMTWDPKPESDCSDQSTGTKHAVVAPCTTAAAPHPWLPIPGSVLVEGGIDKRPSQPYGDHHILLLDADNCRLWEIYHSYPDPSGGWDIFGSATFDLRSNSLRPKDWSSADAAGFPMTPLLLKASEATSGVIHHALRFTIDSSAIRNEYVWPARHFTTNGTLSMSLPPMGQLFRLKAGFVIPANAKTQARAILQALKTYGMYLADGGSSMYISGEPSAAWADDTFAIVQAVSSSEFEAVDITPITKRAGFDPNSAAVPEGP
jgi:hypothetical protein